VHDPGVTDTTEAPAGELRGSILGTRVLRVEDPEFLTRGAVYTDDLVDERLAGAVHATFVRSPVAHARITGIDASAAVAAPGVVAVLTADDLGEVPDQKPMMPMYPAGMVQPLLARGVVRFVGEPVAVVLTDDRWSGEDAAELVAVDYDPLPAVVELRDALAGEVLLFPEVGTNVVFAKERAEDDDDVFAGCEVVVAHQIVNQRVAAAPLEVRAAAAAWDGGRLTLWMPNQGAQGSKSAVRGMRRCG
jgi:carbon-monoxide dehydrogenase large subunit